MNNTTMIAKSTWQEGLVMDFSPDNNLATTLTSALNATFLTFNGNEMALLNDMGNGRVETAYLPEGYVPVGTCEFGDIIYIVSYNPLTNKSLIGCFPSPERNISSEEIGGKDLNLVNSDFLETNNNSPTGRIKASSVKKIIFDNSLNPGDKYIIYSTGLNKNGGTITDYGNNSCSYGDFPKLLRLHVVAIEDSGKINYLDSTVKWYNNSYFILDNGSDGSLLKVDLDSYRTTVASAFSIFLSKVSGKLAILAELEKISGFSCTNSVYILDLGDGQKKYHAYLNLSWESLDKNINPKGFVVTKSQWANNSDETTYKIYNLKDLKIKIPIEVDTSCIKGQHIITSKYDLTNCSEYSNFKTEFDYSSLVKEYLGKYNYADDSNFYPRKASLVLEDGLPNEEGNYYINAYFQNKEGYGFTKKDGKFYQIKDTPSPYYTNLDDAFVHNFFSKDITKKFFELTLSTYIVQNEGKTKYYSDLSNLIYLYLICPAMPYGFLEEYAVNGSIDFSKVGSGLINLSEWRYYNDRDISTITFGIEAYPEENMGISKVAIKFYDNNGKAAVLNILDRNSYSGTFTETIVLGSSSNKNLGSKEVNGEEFSHIGAGPYKIPELGWDAYKDGKNLETLIDENVYTQLGEYYYENDAGVLYRNLVYLAEIEIYYLRKNTLGEYDLLEDVKPITFIRWFWTNNMFNEHYFNIRDYNNLTINLDYSVLSAFLEITNTFNLEYTNVINNTKVVEEVHPSLTSLGYNKYSVNSKVENSPNIRMALIPTILDNYDTFTFVAKDENEEGATSRMLYKIREGKTYILVEDPGQVSSDNSNYIPYSKKIAPNKVEDGKEFLEIPLESLYPESSKVVEDYESWIDSLKDGFNLNIIPGGNVKLQELDSKENCVEYVDLNGNVQTTEGLKCFLVDANSTYNLENVDSPDYGVKMLLAGQFYSKITANSTRDVNISAIVYRPLIETKEDFDKYNIGIATIGTDKLFVFNTIINIGSLDANAHLYPNLGKVSLSDGSILGLGSLSEEDMKTSKYHTSSISSIMEKTGADVGIFSMVTSHGPRSKNEGSRSNLMNLTKKFKEALPINSNWVNIWGALSDSKDFLHKSTHSWAFSDENRAWELESAMCSADLLMIKKSNGTYIFPNAFWRAYPSNKLLTLKFKPKTKSDIRGFTSMALIVASTLAQTYYRSETPETEQLTIVSDIITNNNYLEVWKKDFIVTIELMDNTNTNDLFNISKLKFSTYLHNLEEKCGGDLYKKSNKANVTIENNFSKLSNLILFQHTLSYNIRELNSIYNTILNSLLINIYPDIGGKILKKSVSGLNYLSKMFLDLETKELVPYSYGVALHPLKLNDTGYTWGYLEGYSYNHIKLDTNDNDIIFISSIADLLVIENGTAYSRNISDVSNIYKTMPSSDDWKLGILLGFDRNLLISKYFTA